MEIRETEMCKEKGFTIVELLTVMSVIAILIALLVPALGLVRDYAGEVQQKAQLHSIDVGLELYKTEFGSYPESNDNEDAYAGVTAVDDNYCGANKLAEALVGWDLLGFHPKSGFTSSGENDMDADGTPEVIYDAQGGVSGSGSTWAETGEENVKARKGPFLELENANAFAMGDIYTDTTGFNPDNFLLCDEFAVKRFAGVKTGMPILYYKARTQNAMQDNTVNEISDDIYYYPDNFNLLALGTPENSTNTHPLADGVAGADPGGQGSPDVSSGDDWQDFEDAILNTQVTTINRPYRAGSYILICAGKDGLYGTADDIFNFDKKE